MIIESNLYRLIDELADAVSKKFHLEYKDTYKIMTTQAVTFDYLLFKNVPPEIAPQRWHEARKQMRYIRGQLKINYTEDKQEGA
ncbi:hypothetical protein 276BB001_2 [Bacillus phage 276BB001]|nr:hypothetical protein 276BB001_2 [Bacillus phage 276BB001]QFG05923.1 hypothetical protein 280BB001_2 [Bacillus phage 280BB001]QZA70072.1 hypothetical protein 274BB002_2 [Bacillus phage 274BB002]